MALDPRIRTAVFRLAYRAAPKQSVLLTWPSDPADVAVPTAADLVALIEGVAPKAPRAEAVRAALRAAVDSARYWQEPDGENIVAERPEVRAALGEVAEALLSSTVGASWAEGAAPEQWAVEWRAGSDPSPLPSNAGNLLAEWRRAHEADERRAERERPRDPHARWSGTWWSVPQAVLTTRGTVADALDLVEDFPGWETATVIPVRAAGRIREINSADDWAALCRAYPLEATASRRHDWFRVTGRDGRWVIPDWSLVARDWDAVHLTTFGYLCAAASLIEVDAGSASVIGGWAPDSTLWLADVAREWERPREQRQRPSGSDEWTRQNDLTEPTSGAST